MTRFNLLLAAVVLSSCQVPLRNADAQQQTVIRDASGRTVGTASRDSQGTTTFRDAGGRTTGSASPNGSTGTTTFRDAGGRTTGSLSRR
jgi:hypothetical protein